MRIKIYIALVPLFLVLSSYVIGQSGTGTMVRYGANRPATCSNSIFSKTGDGLYWCGSVANTWNRFGPVNTTATSHNFFTAYTQSTGAFTKGQPACSDLSDSAATCSSAAESAITNLVSDLAAKVSTSLTVAGKALSGNITIACADLSNAAASCATDATNASNIGSGTLAIARLGTLSAGSNGLAASATTDATNATNITSGTLPAARIGAASLDLTTKVTGILPQANGGTGTATPAIVAGQGITLTGSFPNQTVATSYGPDTTKVGGIVGLYVGGNTQQAIEPFFTAVGSARSPQTFGAWVRNLALVTSNSNGTSAYWAAYLKSFTAGLSGPPQDVGQVVVKQNDAAGAYGSHAGAIPFYIAQGAYVDVQFNLSGATASTIRGAAWDIVGSTSQPMGTYVNNNTYGAGTTTFFGPSNLSQGNGTEGKMGVVIPYNATAQNLCIVTSGTQSANNSLVLTLRKNGTTSTALVATVAAGATLGSYCDYSDTVSLSAGDWIDWQLVNNANATSTGVFAIGMELVPSGSATGMIVFGLGNETAASGSAIYWAPFVNQASTATEANYRAPMPRAVTAKNMYCLYTTPPGTSSVVATVQKNGSAPASGLVVTMPTSGSGSQTQSDLSRTISFAALDTFDLQTNQASGTNPAISSCSMEVD